MDDWMTRGYISELRPFGCVLLGRYYLGLLCGARWWHQCQARGPQGECR
jgi:hypothetical protein